MGAFEDALADGSFERMSEAEQIDFYNQCEEMSGDVDGSISSGRNWEVVPYNASYEDPARVIIDNIRPGVSAEDLRGDGYDVQVATDAYGGAVGVIATRGEGSSRYVGVVATSEDNRGEGVMRSLVDAVSDMPLTANVSKTNLTAADAFRKLGFSITGDLGEYSIFARA
jgi:hypothetical protein